MKMSILKNYQIVFWPIFEVDADSVGITINRPYFKIFTRFPYPFKHYQWMISIGYIDIVKIKNER